MTECGRCDSTTCPGVEDILDCTTVIQGMTGRLHADSLPDIPAPVGGLTREQQARWNLMIESGMRCLDCGGLTRSTPDGGWCLTEQRHVFVVSRDARRSA